MSYRGRRGGASGWVADLGSIELILEGSQLVL